MKVLQIPFGFYPDPVGGTEVYVEGVSLQLQKLGVACVVAAPGDQEDAYEYQGIPVRRYMLGRRPKALRELYGEGDIGAANSFRRVLALEQPDILHLHAFTPGVSLRLVRMAKAKNIPVIFTYHTPTVTCQRGTMMQWGTEPCHGIMDLRTCARCALHGLFERPRGPVRMRAGLGRMPAKAVARVIGSLPPALGARLGQFDLEGSLWTALRMTELVQLRHSIVHSLLAEVDHLVAVCQWVREVLISNGVPPHKTSLCRQGVMEGQSGKLSPERFSTCPHSPLQIAFVGRLDPTKGVDILIKSLGLIPQAELRLVIYGVAQDELGRVYEQRLRQLATPDKRIEFHPPVPSSKITAILGDYDLLAAPSQLLETGPLVVLEAFAAGTAVIGSRLGGIAELVRDGVDGVLVEAADTREWANALRRLSEDRHLVNDLRRNIVPPRKTSTVAEEMAALYGALLGRSVTSIRESAARN